jgi:pyruvate dehydrogenase E2 component (dihydrolipoyllysine-residue acetyltransferase)
MDILMPQLGETVAEGKISKWFKEAGDPVQAGDNLFEIETDKTSMEVPATFAGTLSTINFHVGEVAKVGAVVAVITGAGEAPPAPAKSAVSVPPAPSRPNQPAAQASNGKSLDPWNAVPTPERNFGPARRSDGTASTPLARRLAAERGIEIAEIAGTGPHGRVVARDVAAAPDRKTSSSAPQAPSAAVAGYDPQTYVEVPLNAMRTMIARRLVEAKQTIPHFYLTTDVEIGRLLVLRKEVNDAAAAGPDGPAYRVSLNDFIIKGWAGALMRVPAANAVWAGDRILRFRQADIGVAVSIEGGLITPVIRSAEGKTVTGISREMKDLAKRARSKKLKPAEYSGGSSSISNLGMIGVREFAAIVNPPQSTILAVGAGRRAPSETASSRIEFYDVMTVTLSCDHRVVDGALGAELLAVFKSIIEHPVSAIA